MEKFNRSRFENTEIIFVLPSISDYMPLRFGGAQVNTLNIAKKLSEIFKITLISSFRYKYKKNIHINKNLKINQVYFPCYDSIKMNKINKIFSIFASLLFYTIQVSFIIIKSKSKVIIFYDKSELIIPSIIAKIIKKKVIFYEGNEYPWNIYRNYNVSSISWGYNIFTGKLALKLADKIIAQNARIKRGMLQYTKKEIEIIPVAVDTEFFKPIFKEKENIVGFLGRLEKEKGVDLLLEIVDLAMKKHPELKFMIIGDGSYKNKFADKKNVVFLSWVPRNKLPDYINKADVFISCQEGIGLGESEILACGRPIITLNSTVNKEIIKPNFNGFLCKPKSEDYLDSIRTILNNEKLLKEMQINARWVAEAFLSLSSIANKWLALISDIIKN
ncbi:MAG: glycosyltransferase family 4 protein [Thermoproteota archaeon]|jgi:glycosyltransferase involved in cell wall biosynthesis|nr:glycosyltransferase family 4 protein [Thermoproteota archaeon]